MCCTYVYMYRSKAILCLHMWVGMHCTVVNIWPKMSAFRKEDSLIGGCLILNTSVLYKARLRLVHVCEALSCLDRNTSVLYKAGSCM